MRATMVVAILLATSATIPPAYAADPLEWKLCKDIARNWKPADDQRTECTMVAVPVDYAKPGGRRITIAVSRVKAAQSTGAILINPGGPGGAGTRTPYKVRDSQAGAIGADHDLIGFDPRGVDYSANISCPSLPEDNEEPPASWSDKAKAKFIFDRKGRFNRRCALSDPELTANLTTDNIARDMDQIRIALGQEKIGFLGISWGTALGASYRTQFDAHVDKMLLDSVMPATFDLTEIDDEQTAAAEANFHDFASWISRYDQVFHFGTTQTSVTKSLMKLRQTLTDHPRVIGRATIDGDTVTAMMLASRQYWPRDAKAMAVLRDGGIPEGFEPAALAARMADGPVSGTGYDTPPRGLNRFQQTAVICNEASGIRDFPALWRTKQARSKQYPIAGSFASWDGRCADWPFTPRQWNFKPGTSPLQLSGHTYESTTPIGWALSMRDRIGGALLTVEDDVHGSLLGLPCGTKVVDFFATGKTTADACPRVPVPGPDLGTPAALPDLPGVQEIDPYRTDAERR